MELFFKGLPQPPSSHFVNKYIQTIRLKQNTQIFRLILPYKKSSCGGSTISSDVEKLQKFQNVTQNDIKIIKDRMKRAIFFIFIASA